MFCGTTSVFLHLKRSWHGGLQDLHSFPVKVMVMSLVSQLSQCFSYKLLLFLNVVRMLINCGFFFLYIYIYRTFHISLLFILKACTMAVISVSYSISFKMAYFSPIECCVVVLTRHTWGTGSLYTASMRLLSCLC